MQLTKNTNDSAWPSGSLGKAARWIAATSYVKGPWLDRQKRSLGLGWEAVAAALGASRAMRLQRLKRNTSCHARGVYANALSRLVSRSLLALTPQQASHYDAGARVGYLGTFVLIQLHVE